jgi:large subunit ribosomal protein L24
MKLKKGDEVKIIKGKDKGKTGKIEKVFPKENKVLIANINEVKIIKGKDKGKTGKIEKVFPKENKVLIANINMYKRHLKARTQNQTSEIVSLTKPLAQANVIFICPKCKKQARVAYKIEKGVKSRVCTNCKSEI